MDRSKEGEAIFGPLVIGQLIRDTVQVSVLPGVVARHATDVGNVDHASGLGFLGINMPQHHLDHRDQGQGERKPP